MVAADPTTAANAVVPAASASTSCLLMCSPPLW
jgi:hypothetical protein